MNKLIGKKTFFILSTTFLLMIQSMLIINAGTYNFDENINCLHQYEISLKHNGKFARVEHLHDESSKSSAKYSTADSTTVTNNPINDDLINDYLKNNKLNLIKREAADYNFDNVKDYVLLVEGVYNPDHVSIHILDGISGKALASATVKNGFEFEDFKLKNIIGDERMEILYTAIDGGSGVGPAQAILAFEQGKLTDICKSLPPIPSAEYNFHANSLDIYFEQLNKSYSMKLNAETNSEFYNNSLRKNVLHNEEISKTIIDSDTHGRLNVTQYVEYGFLGGNEVYSLDCTYAWENNGWKLVDVVMTDLIDNSPIVVVDEIDPNEATNWYKDDELIIDNNNIRKLFSISKSHLPKILKKQLIIEGDFNEYASDGSITFIYTGETIAPSAMEINGKGVSIAGARVGMWVEDMINVWGEPALKVFDDYIESLVYHYQIQGYLVHAVIDNNGSVEYFTIYSK